MSLADKSAFPQSIYRSTEGMTLRQHYASLAMQGFLACRNYIGNMSGDEVYKIIAISSVELADALIAELEK